MSASDKPVTAIVIGAGGRGMTYSAFALENPDQFQIVGAAEPKEYNRQWMQSHFSLPDQALATDWRPLAARPRMADVAIISTQDAMHAEPAIAFARQGYAILLEKPMAPNEEDCRRITEAAKETGVLFAVCHVMRYTRYTQMLKALLDSGAIGEIVSMQHLEPVGYWRNEKESSCMLLAKSCHDLDWIRYIIGERCQAVSSFGSLKHFRKSVKPTEAGSATRCLACAYEPRCPYSAKKIYLGRLAKGDSGWPVDVLAPKPGVETITKALEEGPYGRCVYECDNDVVDHQVVNLLFDNEATATFTMTAFNQANHRKTRIFGTRGEIYGDGVNIEHFDFLTDQTQIISTEKDDPAASILGGHGGGDYGLISRFVKAVAAHDQSLILSGPDESLETHRMVFAAERARLGHSVIDL